MQNYALAGHAATLLLTAQFTWLAQWQSID